MNTDFTHFYNLNKGNYVLEEIKILFEQQPLISILGGLGVLSVIYIILMKYKNKREKYSELDSHEKVIVGVFLILGYPLDILFNLTFFSLWFVDPPKGLTVSDRINRYLTDEKYHDRSTLNKWRMKWAEKIGKFLNKHDSGHVG